jgi:hypothetical protein
MDQVKMCGKCKKKVEKILSRKNKNMSGGYSQFYDVKGPGDVTAQAETATGGSNTNTPLPDNDAVKGFDKNNMPSYSLLGGGKGKKGKKQKGGCAGVCVGGGAAAV